MTAYLKTPVSWILGILSAIFGQGLLVWHDVSVIKNDVDHLKAEVKTISAEVRDTTAKVNELVGFTLKKPLAAKVIPDAGITYE